MRGLLHYSGTTAHNICLPGLVSSQNINHEYYLDNNGATNERPLDARARTLDNNEENNEPHLDARTSERRTRPLLHVPNGRANGKPSFLALVVWSPRSRHRLVRSPFYGTP